MKLKAVFICIILLLFSSAKSQQKHFFDGLESGFLFNVNSYNNLQTNEAWKGVLNNKVNYLLDTFLVNSDYNRTCSIRTGAVSFGFDLYKKISLTNKQNIFSSGLEWHTGATIYLGNTQSQQQFTSKKYNDTLQKNYQTILLKQDNKYFSLYNNLLFKYKSNIFKNLITYRAGVGLGCNVYIGSNLFEDVNKYQIIKKQSGFYSDSLISKTHNWFKSNPIQLYYSINLGVEWQLAKHYAIVTDIIFQNRAKPFGYSQKTITENIYFTVMLKYFFRNK